MNLRILFGIFFILSGAISQGKNPSQNFDKPAFYSVMASGIMDDIDKMLTLLNSVSISEKDAYEGALMMRKSGLLKVAKEKLKFFKKGRIKLETELLKDSSNCEYRFLRLTIQEHAPKVVKYSSELQSDKQFIIKCFKTLSADVQKIIFDYSKKSKILKQQDFKFKNQDE